MQNDNFKIYEKVKRLKPSQKTIIEGKDGLTANPKE